MKIIFSEYPADYNKYRFPYQIWGIEENPNDRDQFLEKGFLPSRMKVGLWYLARSCRIDLKNFNESSENRRVLKNTDDYVYRIMPIKDFIVSDEVLHLVKNFSDNKMAGALSEKAAKRIFSSHMSDIVMLWTLKDTVVGYVPLMKNPKSMYYWFAFFDESSASSGLGTRMMLEAVKYARSVGLGNIYLGTVYTNSSLYKTNFSGFEFFNGFVWSNSKDELKYLIGKDQYKDNDELFKDEIYLNRFNSSSLNVILRKATVEA